MSFGKRRRTEGRKRKRAAGVAARRQAEILLVRLLACLKGVLKPVVSVAKATVIDLSRPRPRGGGAILRRD